MDDKTLELRPTHEAHENDEALGRSSESVSQVPTGTATVDLFGGANAIALSEGEIREQMQVRQQHLELSPGTWLGKIFIVRPLGRGGGGSVYLGMLRLENNTDVPVVVKILRRQVAFYAPDQEHAGKAADPHVIESVKRSIAREPTQEARREAVLMGGKKGQPMHPNLARLYGKGVVRVKRGEAGEPQNLILNPKKPEAGAEDYPYLVMEYYSGGSLEENGNELFRSDMDKLLQSLKKLEDVASALQALHGAEIAHRDVRPGNIFIGGREKGKEWFVLGDLGFVIRRLGNHLIEMGQQASPGFTAPEQILTPALVGKTGDFSLLRPKPEMDLFAFGATLYYLITGETPLPTGDYELVARDFYSGKIKIEDIHSVKINGEQLPKAIADLVMQLLSRNPKERNPQNGLAVALRLAIREAKRELRERRLQPASGEVPSGNELKEAA